MRSLFGFFQKGQFVTVLQPLQVITIKLVSSSKEYSKLSPRDNPWIHKQLHAQHLKARTKYLKAHAKGIYNKKLKGCRIHR